MDDRPRQLHPVAVVLRLRRVAGHLALPALVVLLPQFSVVRLAAGVAVVLVAAGAWAVLDWLRFSYRIADGALVVDRGVLTRERRVVPLDRVRGLDVEATPVHRLFGVTAARVEVAAGGQGGGDVVLAAVAPAEAERLRAALVAARVDRGPSDDAVAAPPPLLRLGPRRLALAGLTSLRYLAAPAVAVGFVLQVVNDVPGLDRAAVDAAERAPREGLGLALAAAAAVALVPVVAAAGSLLVDWDFTLRAEGGRVVAQRGLLTRRSVALDRERLRGVDVQDSPLRRLARLAEVRAIVGGVSGDGREARARTTLAPAAGSREAWALAARLDPALVAAPLRRHPRVALRRRLLRAVAPPLLAATALAVAGQGRWAAVALAASALAVPLAIDRYRALGHAFDGRALGLRSGSLRRVHAVVRPDAIVAYRIDASPFQRRQGVCTLAACLGRGAGSRHAVDIDAGDAGRLLARLDPALVAPLVREG